MVKQRIKRGIDSACQNCGKLYYVSPCRIGKSHYCSKECFDTAQTGERKNIICQRCGTEFLAAKDHGIWPKSCSLECRDFGAPKPEWKECATCSGQFLATRSSHKTDDGLRIYCSFKCSKEGLKRGYMRTCICCGMDFYLNPATAKQRNDESCCSAKCQKLFYTETRAPCWKGGKYLDTTTNTTRVMVKSARDGVATSYIGEHRIIASQKIGRMLKPHEPILHINHINTDNRPENLFVCATLSEMTRRLKGSMPWPQCSNLESYK